MARRTSAAVIGERRYSGTRGLRAAPTAGDFVVDDTLRGIPAGTRPFAGADIDKHSWSVTAGDLASPVLTIRESAYRANRDAIFAYAREHGVLFAPHAKTPMSPEIAHDLVTNGAWGLSVANLQQASVLLGCGTTRLLLANQIGGATNGERLGRLLVRHPEAEVVLFVDSETALAAAMRAGEIAGRPQPVMIEMGLARGGCRTTEDAQRLIDVAGNARHLRLAGVAAYEGAVASDDDVATQEGISMLNALSADVFAQVRKIVPNERLILSSGGSQFFDLVVSGLKPVADADGNADLMLRSGAIFFYDHGVYARAMKRMDARGGFVRDGKAAVASDIFEPAMRLWAEVLSRPEPGLAICGLGMRDVSFDQGFPVALAVWRDGKKVRDLEGAASIEKLNDQHGFLRIGEGPALCVGDLVEFGISHPCTCFDRWRAFFVIDDNDRVTSVHQTFFG
ncbi:alanine racemase [Chelativorans sp. AA-79]|uniref:alanine racemase n=1 Tax=Chelativorans sp. AA-79 TaxID=3028735 RepID=UPI0023F6C88E|nr:alanine racemase [Chelativorans sp. AA-79]WEX10891.1 alanine racemase [Chelativorans sp. AA-79]